MQPKKEAVKNNVVIGDQVKIIQKNGTIAQGMVRTILRDYKGEQIVELFNGQTGTLISVIPKRPKLRTPVVKPSTVRAQYTPPHVPTTLSEREVSALEGTDREYKTSALWSQDLSRSELERMNTPEVKKYGNRASKVIIAKTLAAFLNTQGGTLLIGVHETTTQDAANRVVGIEREFAKLKNKDKGEDGYKRMIMDDIIRSYFPKTIFNHFNEYFTISFPKKDNTTLCQITVKPSESEVFITIANTDHFFIRVDTETRELMGKETIDYIKRHFG